MVDVFVVDDQKAVVGFGEVFDFDCRVLLIVFVQVCFELFGNIAGEDCCFHAWISFGKQHQNTFIYVIVNQDDCIISFFYQL